MMQSNTTSPFIRPSSNTPLSQAIRSAAGQAPSSCLCAAVCEDSRAQVLSHAASTTHIAQEAANALAQAASLTWTGTAGERFHAEVRALAALAHDMERDAQATARFIAGTEALL